MKYYLVVHGYNIEGGRGDAMTRENKRSVIARCSTKEMAEAIVEKYSHPVHWSEKICGNTLRSPIDRMCGRLTIMEKEIADTLSEAEEAIDPWWLKYEELDGTVRNAEQVGDSRWHFSWKGAEKEDDGAQNSAELPIDCLELSVRAFNCLMRANIKTCGDLCDKSEEELKRIRNLGAKSAKEIIEKLHQQGLELREEGDTF